MQLCGVEVVQDANRLHDRAQAAGVESQLELYPVETHVFHLFWDFLPEAVEGLRQAADFVQDAGVTASSPRPA